MNENFIKVMWQQDENGNPPTGFAVMAQGGVRGSMMAAAIVARSVVSVSSVGGWKKMYCPGKFLWMTF
uniref:hypothetical protein n=1 Tax=Gemmiger formicilis TaxID=745368 RepID=UPI003FEF78D0